MAGEWASALGAAILNGTNSYTQLQQMTRERQRQERLDAQNAETIALQQRGMQESLNELPRERAAKLASFMLQRDGVEGAYSNPAFVQANAEAGAPLQVSPKFAGPTVGNPEELGYFPQTGVMAPTEFLQQRQQLRQKQAAQNALLKGGTPESQMALTWQMATGSAPPAEMLKNGWEFQKLRDPMGGEYLVRVNRDTGETRPMGGPSRGLQSEGGHTYNMDATGDAALAGVDPKTVAIVKQLADYKYPLPATGSRLYNTPYWQNILSLVPQYDPTWTASDYDNRKRLKADFMSGQGSNNKASLAKLTQHLANLRTAGEALNNTGSPTWNAVKNSVLPALTDDPRQGNFQRDALAVSTELAAYLKGNRAAPTNEEINHWMPLIGQLNGGPNQLNEGFTTVADIIAAQAAALDEKWATGMGKSSGFSAIDPETAALLEQLRGAKTGTPMPRAQVGPRQPSPTPAPSAKPGGIRILSITPEQ